MTALKGQAQLTRAATQTALRFKDSIILRDTIDTRERSLTRILLGGKSTITVGELSRLEVREEILPSGATRSILDLSFGSVLVSVAPRLLGQGDEVQIRTGNAVAFVRGSTIFAQTNPLTFTVLSGAAIVTFPGLAPVTLGPLQSVTFSIDPATGAATPGQVVNISPADADQIQQNFDTGLALTEEAGRGRIVELGAGEAAQLADAIVQAVEPAAAVEVATLDLQPETNVTSAPVTAGGTGATITEVTQPEVQLINVTKDLASGETLKTFDQNINTPRSPFILISGSKINQSGPDNLIQVNSGVIVTLTGQLLDVTNSTLSTGGSLVSVEGTLTSTGTAPLIQIDPTTIATGGFGSVTTFDEDPPGLVPVDGLTFNGVTYGFTIGGASSTDANFGSFGPGNIEFVQDPSLEGNASGFLTFNFTSPISHLQFGFARSTFSELTPGASVTLQAEDGTSLGTFDLNTTPLQTFSEGLFVFNGGPAKTAVVTFPSADTASRFALDNLAIFDGGLIVVEGSEASIDLAGPLLRASSLALTGSAPLLNLKGGASLKTGGPSLNLIDSNLDLSVVVLLTGGSTFTTTTGPVIRISGGSLTADALAVSDSSGNTFNLSGSLLDLTNTAVTLRTLGDIPDGLLDSTTFSLAAGEPLIRVASSSLTMTGAGEELISFGVDNGDPIIQTGVALIATGTAEKPSTIDLAGPLLDLAEVDLTDKDPQVQLNRSQLISQQTSTSSSSSTSSFDLFDFSTSPPTKIGTRTTDSTSSSSFTSGGGLLRVCCTDATVNLAGPLLSATDSGITTGGSFGSGFLNLASGAPFTGTGAAPLIQLTNSPLTARGASTSTSSSTTTERDLAGNVTATSSSSFDSSSTSGGGLLSLFGGSLTNRTTMALDGALLSATDSAVTTGFGPFLNVSGASDFTSSTAEPLLQLSVSVSETGVVGPGSPLIVLNTDSSTSSFTNTDGTTSTSTSTFRDGTFVRICCGTFDFSTSPVTRIPTTMTLAGPLISATNSAIQTGTFMEIFSGGSLSSSGTAAPLIELSNSSLTAQETSTFTSETRNATGTVTSSFSLSFTFGSFLELGGTMGLASPLLNAVDSDLTVANDLVQIFSRGKLTSSSTDPFVAVSGGRHSIGSGSGGGNLFDVRGFNTDSVTGLGTDKSLETGGKIFEATGGATVTVGGETTGKFLRLDRALLEASAPIISLIGSSTTQSLLTTGNSTMDLFKSRVTSLGPVVALDKGLISVKNGPLLNITGGTTVTVTGDLLSLINGSKINVLNGPLASVDGTGSLLSVSQALVNFGGTGGNTIIVNNTITSTATLSGLPVNTASGGAITIGPNPITNPSLGTITVTGSLIQATNSGVVDIKAP